MESISSVEMEILDTNCEYYGLSRIQLMENAGKALADEVRKRFENGEIIIIAGRGNNGGDGFVMARHLNNFDVKIYLLGRKGDIRTDEARKNFEVLEKAGYEIREIRDSSLFPDIEGDILVDAILGTGVKGSLRGLERKAVEEINSSKCFKLAVDVPTGLDPDTGKAELAVKADLTVTFHRPKTGLLRDEARKFVGELVVSGIGIPHHFEKLVGVGDVKHAYRRNMVAHKGQHGRILIVGGGEYTGAPALTAMASLYAGADIAIVSCPESISSIVSSFSPNMIVRSYPGKRFNPESIEEIKSYITGADVVVVGMGIGRDKETLNAVREIIRMAEKVVIDADALYAVDKPFDNKVILTPHEGEFERTLKPERGWNKSIESKEYWVKKMAEKLNATIVLKNPQDIISDGKRIKINRTGNAGMTVGGTGDVLAGVIASFFALSNDPFISASAGAFVTGMAGDIISEKMGYSFTAMEVAKTVPDAINMSLDF